MRGQGKVLAAVGLVIAGMLTAAPAQAYQESRLGTPGGPCPDGWPIYTEGGCVLESWLAAFSASPSVVRAGNTITFMWRSKCGQPFKPGCILEIDWGWLGSNVDWKRVSGCKPHNLTCTVRVPKDVPTTPYYGYTGSLSWDGGKCSPCGMWPVAIVGAKDALITGRIVNKQRQPVLGLRVRASGPAKYVASTGADGTFAMVVEPGRYKITPEAPEGSRVKVVFDPASAAVAVRSGKTERANFTVDSGFEVDIHIDQASAPADGLQVVSGKVSVTEYGVPKAGAVVALWPQAEQDFRTAVRTGPRATICGTSGRVWPGGTLADPSGPSVDVTMNAQGEYPFTLNVGTVPGDFEITAWARDAQGQLMPGRASSDTRAVTFTPVGSAKPMDEFVPGLKAAASFYGSTFTSDANAMMAALVPLGAASSGVSELQGFAYSPINGNQAFIISPSGTSPSVAKSGRVTASGSDLVFSPADWNGKGVPVDVTSLTAALQKGLLNELPTFAQWSQGIATGSWNGTLTGTRSAQVPSSAFQYYGWPYPSSTPGSCG